MENNKTLIEYCNRCGLNTDQINKEIAEYNVSQCVVRDLVIEEHDFSQ